MISASGGTPCAVTSTHLHPTGWHDFSGAYAAGRGDLWWFGDSIILVALIGSATTLILTALGALVEPLLIGM